MSRRPALVLLIVFATGGVVAPAVHRVQHVAQAGAALASHEAAGHHHHAIVDAHGLEWTPACDRPVALDELTCVLCKGLSAIDVPGTVSWVATAVDPSARRDFAQVRGSGYAGASRVRGPPHLVA